MANSLLDRVPNLPRAEDLDMRNFSRNSIGPQPLPGAMRPNMRDSVGAQPQPQAQPQARPQYQNAASAREVPRNASNPAAAAAYQEMDRNAARPMPTQAAPTPTARDMMRNAGNSVAQGAKNYANQASTKAAADAATKAAVRGAQAQAAANGGMIAKAKNLVGTAGDAVKSGLGKAGLVAGSGVGAYNTVNNLREGNYGDAALSAADTAATFGLTNPVTALPSGLWLGGRTISSGINAALDTDAGRPISDAIGGSVNKLGQATGLWGVDDSAYLTQKAESEIGATTPPRTASRGVAAGTPAAGTAAGTPAAGTAAGTPAAGTPAALPAGGGRGNLTNTQVGELNPAGRVTVTRDANGRMEFSGGNVSGPVSYSDGSGNALPGAGLRGSGWNDLRSGSNIAMGPGGYAATPAGGGNGITGRAQASDYPDGQLPQIIQDARRSQAAAGARAQQLGVNIGGMAPWQAEQYMNEVQQARNINASQQANAGSYEERLRKLADPTSDVSKAMRALTGNIPDQIKGRGRWVSEYQQKQMETARALAGDYLGETDRVRKDATTRYGTDVSSQDANRRMDVDIRNTDVKAETDRYTADASRRSAAARLEYDRSVGERTYRDGRRDTTQKRLDDVFTTLADDGKGNVNPRRMAELRTAANSFISESADALEKQGDLAGAKELREVGVAALEDPSTMAMFTERMQIKDISSKGWLGHTNTKSNALPGVARIEGDTVYLTDGSTMPYGAYAYQGGWLLPDRWGQYDWTSDRRMWSTTNNQR